MLGLSHSGQYGDVDHFVDSAMSYFAYSYRFSVFEKDALRRIHVDKLIMEIIEDLELLNQSLQVGTVSVNTSVIPQVEALLAKAEDRYRVMDYSLAFNYALNAYSLLLNALNTVETPSKYLKSMEGLDIRIKEINILNSTISSLRSDIDMLRM